MPEPTRATASSQTKDISMAESEFTGAHLANLQSLQYKTPQIEAGAQAVLALLWRAFLCVDWRSSVGCGRRRLPVSCWG